MSLSTGACLSAIESHSRDLAEAARGHLDARVEHCPDWSVADLVRHVVEVQWFWAAIAGGRLAAPPGQDDRPAPPTDDELLGALAAGTDRLVGVLADADQSAACWTWAVQQGDVAFVTRHQVQEAAVHHWDAVNAAGGTLSLEPEVAADAVDEFLTFSVSADAHPEEWGPLPPLEGPLVLHATDTGDTWALTDGARPGTVATRHEGPGSRAPLEAPTLAAGASDLLLWIYGRVEVDTSALPDGLAGRFRALCFTD